MEIRLKTWLYDILSAIREVESFVADIPDFSIFQDDLKARRAVERNLEIIGEAMSRILKRDSTLELTNARKIIETRNRIIHGYDTVSDEIIWSIIINHLPLLKQEVEQLLDARE